MKCKTCPRCTRDLPITSYRFVPSADRYESWCIQCQQIRQRERWATRSKPVSDDGFRHVPDPLNATANRWQGPVESGGVRWTVTPFGRELMARKAAA